MRPRTLLAALSFAACATSAAVSPAAAIESIDCRADLGRAERTICGSERLQILDAQVTQAYADIMLDSRVRASIKQAVYDSQIEFLRRRNACGSDRECLAGVMERRASRIRFYL